MAEIDYQNLLDQTLILALGGEKITVPLLQEKLSIIDENIAMAVIKVLENYGKIIYVDVEGERFWIDVNKLQANFGMPDAPEKDETLIDLITSAKKCEIPVYTAIVDIQKIKPFCEYKPNKKRFEKAEKYLKGNIEKQDPPHLHVYQNGEYLIMSDDYNAYYMYIEEGFKMVPCIIFGEVDLEGVQNKELINYI